MMRRIQSYPVDHFKNFSNQGRKIAGEVWLSRKQKEKLPYEQFPQGGMKECRNLRSTHARLGGYMSRRPTV